MHNRSGPREDTSGDMSGSELNVKTPCSDSIIGFRPFLMIPVVLLFSRILSTWASLLISFFGTLELDFWQQM